MTSCARRSSFLRHLSWCPQRCIAGAELQDLQSQPGGTTDSLVERCEAAVDGELGISALELRELRIAFYDGLTGSITKVSRWKSEGPQTLPRTASWRLC
jgi:hypothetical protein